MRINFARAAIAGVVGTIAFDLVGFALTGTFWDIPALLGGKLFGGSALVAGVIAHYANGILLAVIYAAVAPSLWGGRWTRALTYITVETVFGVWLFMAPLLGAGPLGLKLGLLFPVIALVRHWAYAAALAAIYPVDADEAVSSPSALEQRRPARAEAQMA